MIQIRQKRQNLRNKVRKQYLQNHFKTQRKRLFDFGDDNLSQNTANIKALQNLLAKSQDQNRLVYQIREGNLFNELNLLIQTAVEKKDKFEAKYLLTIISNIFRDDINPFEKEELFKISVKLFQSLNLSFIDFQSINQKKEYRHTLETISSAVLSYYISTVIIQGQYLQQRDQQFIQKNLYPALLNLLFYSLKHPKLIGSPQEFCKDLQRAIFNIFDMKESSYETGNLYKAKRNEQFFIDIVMNHYFYINESNDTPQFFQLIEKDLFFIYDKLTEYFEEIKHFFNIKEFWMVIEHNFQQQVSSQSSNEMIHIYSIMRTFIDNNYFINEINQLMLSQDEKFNMSNFEIIMRQLSYNKSKQFQILQFLQGIMISYQQKNSFKQIIEFYGMNLFEILTNIFLEFDKQSLSDKKQRKILAKSLEIIFVFIQKGNQQIQHKRNEYIVCFEKNFGTKKLQQITEWSEDSDLNSNSELTQILQIVDWLSYQFEFTSSDDQNEI